MSEKPLDIDGALTQISNLVLALAQIQAKHHPEETYELIGRAVIASRKQEAGDQIVHEVFRKTFPGRDLPASYSLDIPPFK